MDRLGQTLHPRPCPPRPREFTLQHCQRPLMMFFILRRYGMSGSRRQISRNVREAKLFERVERVILLT